MSTLSLYAEGCANMPPYLYPLPQTSTLILGGNLFIDPSNAYSSHLAQASQARTRLQLALKAADDAKTNDSAAVGVIDVGGASPPRWSQLS